MNLLPDAHVTPAKLRALYLQDHLTAAVAGVELFRRAAKSQLDEQRRRAIGLLADEVAADKDTVDAMLKRLGVSLPPHRIVAGWTAEKVGRLKPNGTLWRRSPLSDLLEVEAMRAGVAGKMDLWRLLQHLSTSEARLRGSDFDALLARARSQYDELGRLHQEAAEALRS